MGIALLTLVDLWMPLQSLASRCLPAAFRASDTRPDARQAHRPRHAPTEIASNDLRYVTVRPACTARNANSSVPAATPTPTRPLRVVRMVDMQQGRQRSSNRVVISGRMADVCAELERLAAIEASEALGNAGRPAHLH